MGTKTTPTQLSGVLVPHRWDPDLADDRDLGTDYDEADPQYGAVTWSGTGSPPLRLAVSGTPATGVTSLQAKITSAGAADGAAAVRWSDDGGTTWYGRDHLGLTTGYRRVRDEGRHAGIVPYPGGGCVAVWYEEISGTTWGYRSAVRSSAGAWSVVGTIATATIGGSTYTACDVAVAPDGSFFAVVAVPARTGGTWQLDAYRSTDGASWRLAARALGGWSDATPPRAVRLAFDPTGGSAMMLVSYDVGGAFTTIQYGSADGGATWSAPDVNGVAYMIACDVVFAAGVFMALVHNIDLTPDQWEVYRSGSALSDLLAGEPTYPSAGSPLPTVYGGGALVADERGVVYAYVTDDTTRSLVAYESTDGGATWVLREFGALAVAQTGTSATVPGSSVAGCLDLGTVVLLSSAWDGAAVSGGLYELRMGGSSAVTMSTDIDGWRLTYMPTDSMVNYGWSATDTGAPTIALDEGLGQHITTGGGDTASRRYTVVAATAAHAVWSITSVHVTSGTLTIRVRAAGSEVLIDVTSTQIRAYDSGGAAPAYTNHGAGSDYVEIAAVVDTPTSTAAIWYRAASRTSPGAVRDWTELDTLTGLSAAGNDIRHWISWATSSEAYILWAGVQWTDDAAPRLSTGQDVDDLRGLPLSVATASSASSGASIAAIGGVGYPDGETYTSAATSQTPRGAIDPRVAPSPRAVWRSTGSAGSPLSTTVRLRHTLAPETASTAEYLGSDVWAIWLDGLVGVPKIRISDAGGIIASLDLRQTVLYQSAGDSVRPTSAAGSSNTRPWVQPDELVGGYFEYSNGDVRRIARNTAGALTDTGTPSEVRATIYVEGTDGGEATSGTGYVWPPRSLILWYHRGSQASIQQYVDLEILNTYALGPEGYREIGVCAMGRVQVLGYGVDRTEARPQESGYDVETLPDRSTVRTQRGPIRRRAEVAIVDTHVDVTQVRSLTSSADYVVVSAHASAYPAADRHADPLVWEGLAREVDGTPVVWLPRIPVESGSGAAVVAYWAGWGLGALYGYMAPGRRERLQIGSYGVSDGYRYSTIVFEEEV